MSDPDWFVSEPRLAVGENSLGGLRLAVSPLHPQGGAGRGGVHAAVRIAHKDALNPEPRIDALNP